MILTTAPGRAHLGRRLRLAILVAVALLVAHTAIYAVEDGLGGAFAAAMTAGGHDGWWAPVSVTVLGLGVAVAVAVAARLLGLERRARQMRAPGRDPAFGPEVRAIARRLVPLVLVLFTLQENLEQLVAVGRVPGIEAVVGPAHPLAVPVLVLVALALSVAGALVRWRIATLRIRIAADRGDAASGRIRPSRAGARWRTIGDLAPRRWMLDRLDAGRSPPAALRA